MKLYVLAKQKAEREYEIRGLVRDEPVAKSWSITGGQVFEIDAGFGLFSGVEVNVKQWEATR